MCGDEPGRRRVALAVLGFMIIIFIILSVLSFTGSRKQATPDAVTFGKYSAVDGRRVFQAYNCMGCHAIVGNGAYFGPDLTDLYRRVGPAWLAAFLPSAGAWPTAPAVSVQLQDAVIAAKANANTLDAYLAAYPAARERIERRGGGNTFMPNLPLTRDEIGQLIAFLEYTSAMNTEGWPPRPLPGVQQAALAAAAGGTRGTPTAVAASAPAAAGAAGASPAAPSPAAEGAQLVKDLGCLACHSTGTQRTVGPGWGGLYGSQVKLADGSTVKADEAYLEEKIVQPGNSVVQGYPPGVMPSFETLTTQDQRDAIVAYIRSLGSK